MSRVLSLFTGIGGLDLGFEAAGFEIAGSVELDPVARASLTRNRSNWHHVEPHDIAHVDPAALDVGSVDVITGAPPCQPFSKAAQWMPTSRRGIDDDRGELIFDVLDLIAAKTPKVAVLENVRGFVQGRTSVLPILSDALERLESETGHRYVLDHRVLDAHEFGTPQHRRRAIVVLSRVGDFPWPEPDPESARPCAWDAIGDLGGDAGVTPEPGGKWAELLPSIPEGENYQWHTNRGGGLPLFGYRTRYWSFLLKLAKAQPAWTLAAQPGPSTGPFHWDSRPLSVTEMLRLQSFPADWTVTGTRREQVRQIGNATPPALAERLGRAAASLLAVSMPSASTYSVVRSDNIPEAAQVRPVASRYLHLVDEHPDHPGTGLGPAHTKEPEPSLN